MAFIGNQRAKLYGAIKHIDEGTMKLKNYTTSVPVVRSIAEIEKILIDFGCTQIMKEYLSDGTITTLIFRLQDKGFKIPANADGVLYTLYKAGKETKARRERAYRVAWRIIRDWVHAQLSMILSGQAKPDQVLLPYMWDGKKTFYEAYQKGELKLEDQSVHPNAIQQ